MPDNKFIHIKNATENNLKGISLEIPGNRFTVVSGVSGSGKSTLVYDVLFREANHQYIGSFSQGARQFFGKINRPAVESVRGLTPAISVDQKAIQRNPRSTAGTMTGIYDLLRLHFARFGRSVNPDTKISRSLFSFNSTEGACPVCRGLGVEDYLDPELIVEDENRSLRDRALVITAPNGYIIYSQVTMDVMDQVCRAEGFSVDIPWKDLTPEQKHIIFYGSNKIEIPYGKHPLESRMKWTGITAKPRETGYYKGILPVMETILKRDRNENILRFVRTVPCHACEGKRLNPEALNVKIGGKNIHELASLQADELEKSLNSLELSEKEKNAAGNIFDQIGKTVSLLSDLGLGYITCTRNSTTLSSGEAQRIRLAVQTRTGLTGITYLFDEPSVGLHPSDTAKLIRIIKGIRDEGNTVIVIEHDEEFIRHADWLIDIGPGAGIYGGEVIFSGPVEKINELSPEIIKNSRTISFFIGKEKNEIPQKNVGTGDWLIVEGVTANNLKKIDAPFMTGALNVVTGVSGAGKSSLVEEVTARALKRITSGMKEDQQNYSRIINAGMISGVINIDQSPIGRTPRSNPATYTGVSEVIRDIFAKQAQSEGKQLTKSHFSFNTEGGRCEACQGAGYQQTGMHFMGNVEVVCEICEGKRFRDEILEVNWRGKNISEVLEMFISEAIVFFDDQPKVKQYLGVLDELGLGYLKLGQRSSTLSGGEAQRVKLAAELARKVQGKTLYILDEPTTGLHNADVGKLLRALFRLNSLGHTVIVTEHHPDFILAADHVIDLGPGSGKDGGQIVVSGPPQKIKDCKESLTGKALRERDHKNIFVKNEVNPEIKDPFIILKDVTTNNLKNISVNIPKEKITVITGVSGSGKSSLAYDTLFAEGKNRFLEGFSSYIRTRAGIQQGAEAGEITGLIPVLSINQEKKGANARSTVGTITGIYDLYRLLYSRTAISESGTTPVLSSLFAFNHHHGACEYCDGLGKVTRCDVKKLVTHPERSLPEGALDGTKTGKFYGDTDGQYIATLKAAGETHDIDFSVPWNELDEKARSVAMEGTGDEIYDVTWNYRRGERSGSHHFNGTWKGFLHLVNEEYVRKHADHRGNEMLPLMKEIICPECLGKRLNQKALSYTLDDRNISGLASLPAEKALLFFENLFRDETSRRATVGNDLKTEIIKRLRMIAKLGLSYISIDRETSTLSGGEYQRIKLASVLGSGLTGITYVLDEPTLGLHPSDTHRLLEILKELTLEGNTLVMVEHDRDVILSAEHVIDMGPGAGSSGGEVIFSGTTDEMMAAEGSVTGKYLKKPVVINNNLTKIFSEGIKIKGAFANNLKNADLIIPSEAITAITGVSGAGKSSLLLDVILESWKNKNNSGCIEIKGLDKFDAVIAAEQRAAFSGTGGTALTYTGIFDKIREIYASMEEAKAKKFSKNHFSFNNKEGRCPECEGKGKIRISMDFLPDSETVCETCNGSRYRKEILDISFNGKNIGGLLTMTISELRLFFTGHKTIFSALELLEKTGLGYLTGGQSLDTLSGGESGRLVLANELMKPSGKKCLYLFEEPSAGLHFMDIELLEKLFRLLITNGHTIIIVDHDPSLIANADHIIDIGPGGGENGGNIIFSGTPAEIIKSDESATGRYLRNASEPGR